MKAKKVFENIDFKRGEDPRKALNLGPLHNMPQVGDMQEKSFDLYGISDKICDVFNLVVKNYTPIEEKSNYNWSDGYQTQWITLNLGVYDGKGAGPQVIEKFAGKEYYDKILALMGPEYIPRISLGVFAEQKQWISKNDRMFEFRGTGIFENVRGGSKRLEIDFKDKDNISEWLPDYIKDEIMQQAIWDLRYKDPIEKEVVPQGPHMSDIEHIKIDVSDFVNKYGEDELTELMKLNFMWRPDKIQWEIYDGILKLVD